MAGQCELCELSHHTRWYCVFYEPFAFTVLDCDSCDTPMAVLGAHGTSPTDAERELMSAVLSQIAKLRYGEGGFVVDGRMRQIPDHCHIHARPTRLGV